MTANLDIPQLFIMFIMALTRDVIDFKYKKLKIGRLIFAINYIGYKEQCTMKEIRDYLNVKPSTATRQIDKLVKDLKLVERISSEDDRRNVLIRLTVLGKEVYDYHKEVQERMVHEMVSNLSSEELQITTKVVMKILEKERVIMYD